VVLKLLAVHSPWQMFLEQPLLFLQGWPVEAAFITVLPSHSNHPRGAAGSPSQAVWTQWGGESSWGSPVLIWLHESPDYHSHWEIRCLGKKQIQLIVLSLGVIRGTKDSRSKAFTVMDDLLSCHNSSICMYYATTWMNSDNSLFDNYNFWDTNKIVSYRNSEIILVAVLSCKEVELHFNKAFP